MSESIEKPRWDHYRIKDWFVRSGYARLLGPEAVAVWNVLWMHADEHGEECWPSAPTVAGYLGNSERTVRKVYQQLERAGLDAPLHRPGRTIMHRLAMADPGSAFRGLRLVFGVLGILAPAARSGVACAPRQELPATPAGASGVESLPRKEVPDTPERRSDDRDPLRDPEKTPLNPPASGGTSLADAHRSPEFDPGPDGMTVADLERFAPDSVDRRNLAQLWHFAGPDCRRFRAMLDRHLQHWRGLPMSYHARKGTDSAGESFKRYLAGRKRWECVDAKALAHEADESRRAAKQAAESARARAAVPAPESRPMSIAELAAANPELARRRALLLGESLSPRQFGALWRGPIVMGGFVQQARFEEQERGDFATEITEAVRA